jgi:energy-coupling factor transporter ATP-binding protein EcfA2
MARILSFRVDGLAGRDEPIVKTLQTDVNVFYGINGSGKTTLLKILHSALAADASILSGLPFKSAEVEIYLNTHGSVFKRRIEQPNPVVDQAEDVSTGELEMGTVSLLPGFRVRWGATRLAWVSDPPEPDGEQLTRYSIGYLPITRLYRAVGKQSSGAKTISEDELDARFAAEVQRRWAEYQADVSLKVSQAQGKGLARILHLVLSGEDEVTVDDTSLEIRDAYERVSAFLGRQEGFDDVLDSRNDFEVKFRTQPRIKSVVKEIDLVEKRIEQLNAPLHRFKGLLESMYSGSKRIVFGEKDITVEVTDKGKIRLPSLSSGEKQLFFIALEAIRCGNSTVIIDEPELSMHVDWQKKLVASLRDLNPKIQLIIATHSPEIIADVADDKIFSL